MAGLGKQGFRSVLPYRFYGSVAFPAFICYNGIINATGLSAAFFYWHVDHDQHGPKMLVNMVNIKQKPRFRGVS
jgi:hypothetical protein